MGSRTVQRQDTSTESVLTWIRQALGDGTRSFGATELATLLTPLGWKLHFPEGGSTAATVRAVLADRVLVMRYVGSPYTAGYERGAPPVPAGPRIAVAEMVHEGEGHFVGDGWARRIGPGDIVLHPPRGRHSIEWVSPHCVRSYVVLVTSLFGRREDAILRESDLLVHDAPLFASAAGLVEALIDPDLDPGSVVGITASQALHGLVAATVASAIERVEPVDTGLVQRARSVILARHQDPTLDADAVARELRVSRRHLFAQFSESPDSFATTLRDVRLEHAAELLASADDDITVRRAARESGFAGQAQLSRAFRERFGLSPSQFRAAVLRGVLEHPARDDG